MALMVIMTKKIIMIEIRTIVINVANNNSNILALINIYFFNNDDFDDNETADKGNISHM